MASLVRIVVAAEDQALQRVIETAALKHPGARVVAQVVQADALMDVVTHRAPQVVFLAARLGETSGYDMAAKLSRRYPGMYIVVASPHANSPEDLRQAMRAGVRECLAAPLDEAAILHVLEGAGDLDNVVSPRRGLVIVVMASKGGVGKTTVAVNLAIALKKELQAGRVALVDGDLYFGDVATVMNIRPERTIHEMSQALSAEIAERFLHRHESGVEVLAAPQRTALAEEIRGERFSEALNVLQALYDLVVVDASASSFDAMLAALEVADLAVVLTTFDVVCLKDTSQLHDMLAQLRFPAQNLLLVGNRINGSSLTRRDVEKALGMKFAALVPSDDKVVASTNSGVPLTMSDPESPFAQQIRALAKTVMTYTGRFDRVNSA